jgi:predicted nucleotidyltransferase
MENILIKLEKLEKKLDIKILYACETGSRAWGFPSPDSDYDVRFIYMHKKYWYLSLAEKKDSVEVALAGDLDITGWDLKKCLVLLKKSNAPLIERFQSPMEYFAEPRFKDDFKKLIESYYSPTAVFFHHHSLAKKFWEDIKDSKEIKLKSYFYLVRSLLSCNWIVKDISILPMDIEGLMQLTSETNRTLLRELITLKATVGEKYLHPKTEALHNLAEELLTFIEASKDNLGVNDNSYAQLDKFFLKTLHGNANN